MQPVGYMRFDGTEVEIMVVDPCYLPEHESMAVYIKLNWDEGNYPVYYFDGRLILSQYPIEDETSFVYAEHKLIGEAGVDSGQMSFMIKKHIQNIEWNGSNGNLMDIFAWRKNRTGSMPLPTTDYASCCAGNLDYGTAGLSPLHLAKDEKGEVIKNTGYVITCGTGGDGVYPVFTDTHKSMVIFQFDQFDDDDFEEYFEDDYEEKF